jgi:hypothetical protein
VYTFDVEKTDKYTEEDVKLFEYKSATVVHHFFGGIAEAEVITEKEVSTKPENNFRMGQQIVFELKGYSNVVHDIAGCKYDGEAFGEYYNDPDVDIKCYFKDDDWDTFSNDMLVKGEIQTIRSTVAGITLWMKPGSLKSVWSIMSKNGHELHELIWDGMDQKCAKCNTEVYNWEIDDCIVFARKTKIKCYCKECTKLIEDKVVTTRSAADEKNLPALLQ